MSNYKLEDLLIQQYDKKSIIAVACIIGNIIHGTIQFTESEDGYRVHIDIDLCGFEPLKTHAIHIHEAGDLTDSCKSACAHLNPYHKNHGGIDSIIRHVGDLGNIHSDANGCVKTRITDYMIRLRGFEANIIGRCVVVHADPDDNGLGGFPDSLTTGHAGARIACAVIGYSKKMFC